MTNSPSYKRCLIILADGARPDVFKKLHEEGKLPQISEHLIKRGGLDEALTVFPSTTGPAYLPFLTGCFPGTCNIPGIRWFDKNSYHKRGWSFKSFRSYVGLETFLMNHDFPQSIKTIYQIAERPISILNMIFRGIKKGFNLTKYSRIWYYYYGHLTDRWSFLDKAALKKVLQSFEKDPDFIYAVFPAIDEYSHRSSPFHQRTLQAYQELDTHLGTIFEDLKQRGWYDDTLVIIVSDHGLSDTHSHFDIGPHLEEKQIKTFFYTQIFKRNFEAASMVSGNGMAHLYFKGQRGWEGRMSFEELSSKSLLIDELRLRPEVDLVACMGQDNSIHILNDRGHGSFLVTGDEFTYKWKHADPLGIFNDPTLEKAYSGNLDQSIDITRQSHYPDIFVQLSQLFKSDRTGDVIISAKSGYDFRERYEVPLHKASHGAICPEHMKIPFISNFPFRNETSWGAEAILRKRSSIRSVDIFPTVLHLLGKPIPKNIDGANLVS